MQQYQATYFDRAAEVMAKIIRSLAIRFGVREDGDDCHHLIGSAYHNLGLVQMWAGKYEEALISFQNAFRIRSNVLSTESSCAVVSLSKLGIVLFAMEQLDSALACFEQALELKSGIASDSGTVENFSSKRGKPQRHEANPTSNTLEIAKLLNNIGVTQYQKGNCDTSLKYFTEALQLQRDWIGGPVKREPIVYDVSVTLANMGKVYLERDDYDMSLYAFEEALMVRANNRVLYCYSSDV